MSIVSQHLEKLLEQVDSHLWGGYVNMLKTLRTVFLSPKHWVLEFLQNAEDAKAKKISIRLGQDSLWILNNGEVFDGNDFHTICDVNSRKLPSLGFRGYIGIGFKSIFRITDQISIHSGNFHFMFSKKHWDGQARKGIPISKWPWEILPIENSPVNLPEDYTTGFYVPFPDIEAQKTLQEIEKFLAGEDFPKEAILLLKNIEKIEIQTPQKSFLITKKSDELQKYHDVECETVVVKRETSKQSWIEEAHYLVFRKTVVVPSYIQQDEETERVRRSDVPKREIGLIFGLDHGKRLQVLVGKLAGVYSFLPVEGEQTGLPFGIFGDFIPQPGREIINYWAKWNRWMCDEVAYLFKTIVQRVFLSQSQWRSFIAEVLERLKYSSVYGQGKEFWEVGLRDPIKAFLESGAFYFDDQGVPRRLDELIAVSDEIVTAVGKDTLKKVLRGKSLPEPAIKSKIQSKIGGIVDIYEILHRKESLEFLKGQPEKLVACYRLISRLSDYYIRGREGRDIPLYRVPFVLADDNEFYSPENVIIMEMDTDQVPRFLMAVSPKEKKHLHQAIAKDQNAVEQLRRCGLHIINKETITRDLTRLINDITDPSKCPEFWKYPDTLIETTLYLISQGERPTLRRFVAQDKTLQDPKNLFVPGTPLDWYPLWQGNFLPGFQPIHKGYLSGEGRGVIISYLEEVGLHGFDNANDKPLIETVAYEIAKERLNAKGHCIVPVTERHKLGYDLQCRGHCESVFEVKGMGEPHDIEFSENACIAAQQKKDDYILVCVYNLPNQHDRIGYKEIPDPAGIWEPVEKAKVPKNKWLGV
jgi:hypothetical protein